MPTKKEIQAHHAAQAPLSDGAGVIAVLERAASNPNVDVLKLEKLLDMQERILERQAQQAYTQAMIEMRPHLPSIGRRGEINIGRGKPQPYAKWEDIHEAIVPVLTRYGFDLAFASDPVDDKNITVTAILTHVGGHRETTSTPPLPHDTSGSKNAVQGVGSTLSYGKRIAATLRLNLRTHDEDDDADSATKTISDEQASELAHLMNEVKANPKRFFEFMDVAKLADIKAQDFPYAKQALEAKRVKK